MNVLLHGIAKWWKGRLETPAGRYDLIVPISYGIMARNRLAIITAENVWSACFYWHRSPDAVLAFSSAAYLFPGADVFEAGMKRDVIRRQSVLDEKTIDAGVMNNTIQEAEAILTALKRRGIQPVRILLVTGEMHVRAVRLIWETLVPWASIDIMTNDWMLETEPGHPVLFQRSPWIWFFYQIARQPIFSTAAKLAGRRGLELFGGIHHLATSS